MLWAHFVEVSLETVNAWLVICLIRKYGLQMLHNIYDHEVPRKGLLAPSPNLQCLTMLTKCCFTPKEAKWILFPAPWSGVETASDESKVISACWAAITEPPGPTCHPSLVLTHLICPPEASQACDGGERWEEMKYHPLLLLFPSWVNITWGFPWFRAIGMLEGRGEHICQTPEVAQLEREIPKALHKGSSRKMLGGSWLCRSVVIQCLGLLH